MSAPVYAGDKSRAGANAALAAPAARTPHDLRWYAAHEPRAEDAIQRLQDALGLPSTELAGFYVPLDNPRRWKLASTGLRAQMLGDWIRAAFYEIDGEANRLVPTPAHMTGRCTGD